MAVKEDGNMLRVSLIGFDQRTTNAIDLIFQGPRIGSFCISSSQQASLTLVDLDKYGAAEEWEALQQYVPDRLAILLSINKSKRDPKHLFVKKPVKITDLIKTLRQAECMLSQLSIGGYTFPTNERAVKTNKERKTQSNHQQVAVAHTIDMTDPDQFASLLFSEAGYLLETIKRSVEKAVASGCGIRLQISDKGDILIDPLDHWVYSDITQNELSKLCQQPVMHDDIVIRSYEETVFVKYLEDWKSRYLQPVDVDAFLWDMALQTYQGRLPADTDSDASVELAHWPDMTRLTFIPDAMKIAALWTSRSMTISETAMLPEISQRSVFDFYSACSTLGLLTQSQNEQAKTGQKEVSHRSPKAGQSQFISKILQHIKGDHVGDG